MSLIVEVRVKEGIVLAGDSRSTYTRTTKVANGSQIQQIGVHVTDSAQKVFLAPNNIGLAICGEASINGLPIAGFVETFIRQKVTETTDVDAVPQLVLDYFNAFTPPPKAKFFIVGYKNDNGGHEQKVYDVSVKDRSVKQLSQPNAQGASWAGEILTLTRLLTPVAGKLPNGQYSDLPMEDISWNYFTLQDAVDFARYAVETTIKTMHFKNVVETVGGEVDILVITPSGSRWLHRKELA